MLSISFFPLVCVHTVVLGEVIQAFSVPENVARMEEARESACNDMGKMLQLVLPVATQIQQEVIKAYGFNNEGEGTAMFNCILHIYYEPFWMVFLSPRMNVGAELILPFLSRCTEICPIGEDVRNPGPRDCCHVGETQVSPVAAPVDTTDWRSHPGFMRNEIAKVEACNIHKLPTGNLVALIHCLS